MDLILIIVFMVLGYLSGVFLLTNIIYSISTSIPLTKQLYLCGIVINKGKIFRKIYINIILFSIILLAICIGIFIFFNKFLVSFIVGLVFATIHVLTAKGQEENKIMDYLSYHQQDIDQEKLQILVDEYMNSTNNA